MAGDNDNHLHREILELLLDKVREDQYPSVTQMNMLEEMLEEEDVESYADVLMDKVRQDTYPSIDQLRRLQRFA
jgi:hypothetical protein